MKEKSKPGYVRLVLTLPQSLVVKEALLVAAKQSPASGASRIHGVHTSVRRQIQRQTPEEVTI